MTTFDRPLPRPPVAPDRGPLDDRLYDLVEERVRRLVTNNPIFATAVGLHDLDAELGDGGSATLLADLAADRQHLAKIEALDPSGLSATAGFERDLEIHNVRREIFDTDETRIWERRSLALATIGDGLFLLFARDHAPLAERLDAIAGRLEAVPRHLEEARGRSSRPQVRLWQGLEIEAAAQLPALFEEVVAAGRDVLGAAEQRRLERASDAAKVAVERYTAWLERTLVDGTDDWALGRERHDALVGLRAFDGLDADEILELGHQKLAEERAARAAVAREIDPDATEADVVARVKADHRPPSSTRSRPIATRWLVPAPT